jgi:phosphoribosylaminoimidazolecarboxamide formyltransferase/IMP cyclohydrolase
MPRALISVSNKTGLAELGRGLVRRGYELVSTGGTARALADAGLAVLGVSDVTAFPEMMDGRVKTLHPLVHGGILARRADPAHMAAAARHGITLIDLVVVNLYPFERAAADLDAPVDRLIEEIDVGGPSLVRAAAKNFQDVLVVVSPGDYGAVLEEIDRDGGPAPGFRLELARKAFLHTAAYDAAIAGTFGAIAAGPGGYVRDGVAGSAVVPGLAKVRDLRYGENPHQTAAWYARAAPAGFGAADVLQGAELSFTNLLDLDAAARIVLEFDEPAAAVIKHTNPCGVAIGATAAEAYVRARDADALSAFGGVVGLNRPIDAATAQAIVSTKIDAVVAPAVAPDARDLLARRGAMRVVTMDFARLAADAEPELRSILGAVLAQSRDRVTEAAAPWPAADVRVASRRQPTAHEWEALRFAWRVCAHVKSNAVIFTSANRTVAIGAGQMSRVDAVNAARMKAEAIDPNGLKGTVAASDAFIPFRDGLDAVAAAGATAVVQTGGSMRDAEVIAAADEYDLAMVFTGRRHFRH